jgi:hypothetical protein
MVAHAPDPLFKAGCDAKWAEFSHATSQQRRAWSMALTPSQRLEVGQRLSQEAFVLLAAAMPDGRVPRRALWSDDLPDLKRLMARS